MHIDTKRLGWTIDGIAAVAFVLLLIAFEYYGFVVIFCGRLFDISPGLTIFILIEIHIFIFMTLWSYFKVITTGPGYLPLNINEHFSNAQAIKERQKRIARLKFGNKKHNESIDNQNSREQEIQDLESARVLSEEEEQLKKIANNSSPILQLSEIGYCFKCNAVKTPRSHHCRQCKRCVIRMDHHCPWVANCIGIHNHKFFILFTLYAVILLLQIFLWELFYFHFNSSNFKQDMSVNDQLVVMINSTSCIALFLALSFLAGFQVFAATKNVTTVEFHIPGVLQTNPFNQGTSRNLEGLFGVNRKEWLIPVDPKLPSDDQNRLLQNSMF